MEEQKNNEFKLVQNPIIKYHLEKIGEKITRRIDELNIDNQIACEDSFKSLKELRAELNKELDSYEDQRKTLKKAIISPYDEFELSYKKEIYNKYDEAISKLKSKILKVEIELKEKKQKELEIYFSELCESENINFLTFENLGIEIKISVSLKKYKEEINSFVMKVCDDLILIESQDFQVEILTEYKKILNVSKAITEVKERKENEKKELERLKQLEISKRQQILKELGFKWVDITSSYEYNQDIFISKDDIQNLSKDEFITKEAELKVKIESISTEIKPSVKEPVKKPVIKEKEIKARFECTGTRDQLIALGEYMKSNNITYKNI